MPAIKAPKGWEIPERLATAESSYLNRREILKKLGFSALGAAGLCWTYGEMNAPLAFGFNAEKDLESFIPKSPTSSLYPAKRNAAFKLDRHITNELVAATYNNFYEFSLKKEVWKHIQHFETRPWQIEVGGEVEYPKVFDIDDLVRKFPLEERLYRHRCVEAWSMAVPWTGFPSEVAHPGGEAETDSQVRPIRDLLESMRLRQNRRTPIGTLGLTTKP